MTATVASPKDFRTVAELVTAAHIGLLTTINAHGQLVSRPLAVQEAEFDGALWFFSQDPSEKTAEIAANPQVNVALDSGKGYLSISGTAEVVHDGAKFDELWTKRVEAWFPEGRADPTIALIKVTAETAEYWTAAAPKAVVLFTVAKAAVTGSRPDIGENRTVEL